MIRQAKLALAASLLLVLCLSGAGPLTLDMQAQGRTAASAEPTSPEKHFGFRLGTDRKIARWDRVVEYFRLLEKESSRIRVVDMGPTTEGNPFLLAFITSPANLARLDRLREINARLSDPRGLAEKEADALVAEGRAVVVMTMSMHSNEIGGTQMAPELAHDLLTRTDEEAQRILDNVVYLMVPCLNPDGQIMIADWYQKTLGTEYEGTSLPWLYHRYAGHDNNRDGFMMNLVESRYLGKLLYRDWTPQAYVDVHQMGSYGARIYIPPYAEPIRPGADPLVWREDAWYGAHMAYKEAEAGLSGVLNAAVYSGWGHFGFHWVTTFHNIAGMLTEAANTRLASPLYIHPDQLRGGTRGLPAYEAQTTFPDPWPGGWWRLRDIVDRDKVAAWAVLDLAARNKETVLRNAYLKAKRQTERGAAGRPSAYVIPRAQHDPLTAVKMVNRLLDQGVEIQQARKEFVANGVTYAAGSFVVPMAQPKTGLIRYLLGRTFYPDNEWTRNRDGSPMRPYDMATDTMAEFMGVRADPVDETVRGDLQRLRGAVPAAGTVGQGGAAYVFDGRLNDSFRAVNLLLEKGVAVRRIDKAGDPSIRPGDFVVGAGSQAVLASVAKETGVDFRALKIDLTQDTHDLKRLRIGMYRRYGGGNMDEGWTRLVLDQFGFPHTALMDAEIRNGGLEAQYDVIILPDDSPAAIKGAQASQPATPVHPDYRSGIGNEGVAALKAFVQKGGTLVTLGGATAFGIEEFGLPVRNVLAGRATRDFYCPGSTLHAIFDNTHPLAYGMPPEGLVLFWNSQAFEISPTDTNEHYEIVVRYPERDLLQSGWLIGEPLLFRKAAVVSARVGQGKVLLIGLRPQARAQLYGTFKLLFNALVP